VLHNNLSSLKFLSLTILHTRKNRQCVPFDIHFAPLAAKLAGLVNKKGASFNAHEFSPVEAFFLKSATTRFMAGAAKIRSFFDWCWRGALRFDRFQKRVKVELITSFHKFVP
jgi:hypothetical protein